MHHVKGEAEMHVHTHSLEDGQRKLAGGPAMTKQQLLSSETQQESRKVTPIKLAKNRYFLLLCS